MKFDLLKDNKFILYVNSSYLVFEKEKLYDNIKKLMIKVRKKYNYDIYGYYDVDIYDLDRFRTILVFNKKDNDEFFRNTIDLKINYHSKTLKVSYDYLINKEEDIISLCEFYDMKNLNLQ